MVCDPGFGVEIARPAQIALKWRQSPFDGCEPLSAKSREENDGVSCVYVSFEDPRVRMPRHFPAHLSTFPP